MWHGLLVWCVAWWRGVVITDVGGGAWSCVVVVLFGVVVCGFGGIMVSGMVCSVVVGCSGVVTW